MEVPTLAQYPEEVVVHWFTDEEPETEKPQVVDWETGEELGAPKGDLLTCLPAFTDEDAHNIYLVNRDLEPINYQAAVDLCGDWRFVWIDE